MPRAMFKYTKVVLEKVSFSPELFLKELKNSKRRLLPYEILELEIWLKKFTANKPELSVYF